MHPLLENYEKYYGKKEEPKIPRIEDYEGEKTIADELKEIKEVYELPEKFKNNSGIISTDPTKNFITATNANVSVKPRALQTYDVDSCKDEFLRVAEKVKQGDARVTCLTMNSELVSGFPTGLRQTVTFEVQV
jgi:hypothetical protein